MKSDNVFNVKNLNNEYEFLFNSLISISRLSSSEFWSLYLINEGINTQSKICKELYLPKQTVHSAIKSLIHKKLIQVKYDLSNLRTKKYTLTNLCKDFVRDFFSGLNDIETEIVNDMTKSKLDELKNLFKQFNELIQIKIKKLINKHKKKGSEI